MIVRRGAGRDRERYVITRVAQRPIKRAHSNTFTGGRRDEPLVTTGVAQKTTIVGGYKCVMQTALLL